MTGRAVKPPSPIAPAPPTPLEPAPNEVILEAGTLLYRVWHRDFAANTFNPGVGRPTRFAPIYRATGEPIPTLYASSTLECAFHERIFHDVPIEAAYRSVHLSTIENLLCGSVRVKEDLCVAALFRPDLARWGLERHQLVHTEAVAYPHTARWAAAIHTHPTIQGMVWTSHRCDPERAYVFFGDRVADTSLEPQGDAREILQHDTLLEALLAFAQRAAIRIVTS